jgi:hypothetical protein
MFFKEYLQKETTKQQLHPSAEKEDLCLENNEICKKIFIINIEEDFKNTYINKTYKITEFINNNLIVNKKLINTLKKIELKGLEGERR